MNNMMNARLIHDAAVGMAMASIDVVGGCLRDEEKAEVWRELVRICTAGIEAYLIQRTRELERMNPTMN
jgi:hypothetical protein